MIFVDQVSAAIPVLLLLTRSKVPHRIFHYTQSLSEAHMLEKGCCQDYTQSWVHDSCTARTCQL